MTTMKTIEWKMPETTSSDRDEELERLENRMALEHERAARAETQLAHSLVIAKRLAARIERKTLESYDKGFEAGVAFAVADADRRAGPRRKVVERDREGRIVAITEESAARLH